MKLKRVVVTGLGALTPLGNSTKEYWEGLINGVNGVGEITRFDASKFKTRFACELKNYDPLNYFERKEARKYDACCQYGLITADEALKDSGLDLQKIDLNRAGVIWGSGIGGLDTFYEEITNFNNGDGTPRYNPFFIPKMIVDITSGNISIKYGFRGPNFSTVSACASASNAIVDAFNYIRLGKADIFITGGSEAAISAPGVGGFNALHALSTRNDDMYTASRPFDKDRDGFVLGEGSAALIVEELEHALQRGATIYAEIIGSGLSADAHHMTAPHPEGLGAKLSMKSALEDAELNLQDIDHINTHGTSTPAGDVAETNAIAELFGEHAPKIKINSTKSMTGHLLGAAGAIESIAIILPLKYGIIPPTINHFTDDPEINSNLDIVFNKAIKKDVNITASNTFGFGGHNVTLIFKKFAL